MFSLFLRELGNKPKHQDTQPLEVGRTVVCLRPSHFNLFELSCSTVQMLLDNLSPCYNGVYRFRRDAFRDKSNFL